MFLLYLTAVVNEIDAGNVRERPPIKWKDRVMEYERERERGCRSERTGRRESEVHGQVQMETLMPWPPLRGSSEEQASAKIDR